MQTWSACVSESNPPTSSAFAGNLPWPRQVDTLWLRRMTSKERIATTPYLLPETSVVIPLWRLSGEQSQQIDNGNKLCPAEQRIRFSYTYPTPSMTFTSLAMRSEFSRIFFWQPSRQQAARLLFAYSARNSRWPRDETVLERRETATCCEDWKQKSTRLNPVQSVRLIPPQRSTAPESYQTIHK